MKLPVTEIAYPEHLKLWNEGNSFTEVAATLKETRGAVAGKLHRMRLKGVAIRTGHAEGRLANGGRVDANA